MPRLTTRPHTLLGRLPVALLPAAGLLVAACSTDSGGTGGDPGSPAGGPPAFRVDPSWPRQLPNDWILGSITSVFVDDRDHVWITHLPETLTPEEIAAVQDPPLGECCVPAPVVIEFDTDGNVVQAWGDPATQDVSEFPRNSHGLFIDHNGFVWIGTFRHHRVMKFTRDGQHLMTLGEYDENGGSNDTELLGGPAGVWVDPATNEVYIADGYRNRRVIVYDADTGTYLRHWGAYGEPPDDEAEYDYAGRTAESAPPPQFSTVHGLVGSNDGLIYVADRRGNRIQVFRQDGTFVTEETIAPQTRASGSAFVIALSPDDGQRWLYLADGTSHKVWVLRRSDLEVVGEFGRGGRQLGQFIRPHGMDVDSRGNVYVGEASTGRRVQRFVPTGGVEAGGGDGAAMAAAEAPAAAEESAPAQADYDYAANCRGWPPVDGPHAVGTVEFEVTDPIHSAQYAPAPTDHRRLYVRAWYPAADPGATAPRPYFAEGEAAVLAGPLMAALQQPPDALRGCQALATNSHTGADPSSGRFPVIGFNHGYTSYPAQQTALFEHLAANGYIVLSVGHPYESGGIVYPNGDVATLSARIMEDLLGYAANSESMTVHYPPSLADALGALPVYLRQLRATSLGQLSPVWESDVRFVLDRLEGMDVPDAALPVAGVIDHDSRGYMGMSYGGYIAAMLAQGDSRARAAINLDGGYWTAELIDADLRTPFLMLNSDPTVVMATMPPEMAVYRGDYGPGAPTPGDLAYERLATAGLRDDIHRIMIPGIQHVGISDLPELIGVPEIAPALGEAGIIAEFTAIQNDLVLGFLDRYVKGADSGFPDDALARYPELMVRDRDDIRRQAEALGLGAPGGS